MHETCFKDPDNSPYNSEMALKYCGSVGLIASFLKAISEESAFIYFVPIVIDQSNNCLVICITVIEHFSSERTKFICVHITPSHILHSNGRIIEWLGRFACNMFR